MIDGKRGLSLFCRVTLPFLAGYFVSYIYRSINAIIGPELAREFSLSAAGLGLLSGVYFLAFALFQLPLGMLLDRYGPRRVNATLLLVAAAGGTWFAFAESTAQLTFARAVIGLGVSGCLMSSLSAFALWHPPERLGTMNGIAFASGMLGAIVATVPLEIVLRSLHWRQVFYFIVGLTVAVSLVLYFVVPEKAAARRAAPFATQLDEYVALLRDPAFWRMALCIGSSQLAAVSLSTLWVATWLRDVAGYSQAEVAQALLLFNVVMIAGYLGFGRIADRMTRRGRSAVPRAAGGGPAPGRAGSLEPVLRFQHFRRAVVLALLAPLPRGHDRARELGAQRLGVHRHVQRPVGRRAGAQPVAAERHRLRAPGLRLGAGRALAAAGDGIGMAVGRAPAVARLTRRYFTSNSPTSTTSLRPFRRSVTIFSASSGVPKRVASFNCSVVAPATICWRLP